MTASTEPQPQPQPQHSQRPPRRPMPRGRRFAIYGVLLVIAFAALIGAIVSTGDPEEVVRPDDVIAVSPIENANEVRQATVFAEVTATHDAVLNINGTEIPLDQMDRLQTGNLRVSFTPGDGKEFTRFPAGRNCARVDYWPVGQVRENTSKSYSWCFNLQ